MKRRTQTIERCKHCGKVFADGEDYWDADRGDCYCDENKCGWEEEYYKD